MCIYVYAYMYISIYVYMCVRMYMRMYMYRYMYRYRYVYVYIYMYMYMSMYMCMTASKGVSTLAQITSHILSASLPSWGRLAKSSLRAPRRAPGGSGSFQWLLGWTLEVGPQGSGIPFGGIQGRLNPLKFGFLASR